MMVPLPVILPPASFYGWFELQSRVTANRGALDAGYANALKHAGASATLYSMLRFFGVRDHPSERIVVGVGIVNEYVEIYLKRGRKDTTLEMMRDLHGNMVGISVARWRESAAALDDRNPSEQLIALARAGVLLRSQDDIPLPPEEMGRAKQSADLDWAISWFSSNKATIEDRSVQALQNTRHARAWTR
jgi:hypothetical protein